MTRARRWTVLLLYALSITLSTFLLYLSLFHCQLHIFGQCTKSEGRSRQKSFSDYLAIVVACTLTACSTCWLLANLRRIENSWLSNYNFLEMPTAVFCSLLAGVCGVVEIHYNFESSHGYNWSEKWTMITTDAVALVFLHAGLAFAH